jgi:hypothetical protein
MHPDNHHGNAGRTVGRPNAIADLLAADPAQVTVTEIATKWNFFHLSRFSGDCASR